MNLTRIFIFFLLLLSTKALHSQRDVPAYIARYDSVAVAIMLEHQFPASLVLGLAIHESGAGTSRLSREQCNHFGMKGKRPSKKTITGTTMRHLELETDGAYFFHFARLFTDKKSYEKLRGNPDPVEWLKALKRTGYAASSKWVSRVNNIIKKYNLIQFDRPLTDTLQINRAPADSLQQKETPR